MILVAILVPIRVCFISTDPLGWVIIDYLFDGIFWIDLLLCFVTAYQDEHDKLIDEHKVIAHNYLTGWFLIDFVAVLPIK